MRFLQSHRALFLAVAGGVLFALTSPPTNIYPAVVLGLALLAASLTLPPEPRGRSAGPAALGFWRAFGRGAAWGTAAGIVGLRFVPAVIQRFTPLGVFAAYLALVLLAAAQSLIWAIAAGVTALLRRHARAPFELAFAIGVFVAVSLPTVFAWTPAGLVSPWPMFVQLADLVGERGVSAIFAVGAALICRSVLALRGATPEPSDPPALPGPLRFGPAARRPALAAVGLFALLAIHGALRMRSITADTAALPTARIGLVDQAVPPLERWDPKNSAPILRSLRELTRKLENDGVELTIWPEAAYPYTLDHDARFVPRAGPMTILGGRVRGPLLIGLITREKPMITSSGAVEYNSYNSATLITPDGAMQAPYDKLQLLWFGEMVPLGAELPWLRHLFQKSGGLIPGSEPRALTLERDEGPSLRMGVLNCYEDTLSGVGRRVAVELAPNLIVNVTNDAWFQGTAEPELHARLAAMRAVELRRDLVRAVNLGVASWIDAAGVVRARYAGEEASTLQARPAIRNGSLTAYARLGDAPLRVSFGIAAVFFALRARRAKKT
ncbi:MAG: apolipoprotein N-acyltransferase [Byssovorax sp.]